MLDQDPNSAQRPHIITFGAMLLVIVGISFEIAANIVYHTGSRTPADEYLSLAATALLAGAALWIISSMGGVGRITAIAVLAAVFFVSSKLLDLADATDLFIYIFTKEQRSHIYEALRDGTMAAGMFFLLLSFLYSAVRAHAARNDLAIRHHALQREMEERKRIEQERALLTAAVDQSAESVMITDSDGLIQYVNPAFEHLTGYSREDTLGRTPRFLRSGKHNAAFYARLWKILKRGEVWRGHFINKKKNGSLFEEEATIFCVRDEAGSVTNYVALKRDVTSEVSLEKQLRQAQKMEAVGTLAGHIAHDFNNMLALIMGHGEIALRTLDENHPARKNVQHILKAGGRARAFVRQILTLGRKLEQERRPVEVSPLVREAIDFLRVSLPATVEIQSHIDEKSRVILADPSQVHQILMNLCTNAFQAMEGENGILDIGLDAVKLAPGFAVQAGSPEPGDYVRVTVSDSGCGMDAETQQRIFEPFFTTKKPGVGTGLGLSTVHGIVMSYGGAIRVHSAPQQGTTFEIYLPLMQNTDGVEDIAPGIPLQGEESILLVDDDQELLQMTAAALSSLGYSVDSFSRPGAAAEHFSTDPARYDLVITDQVMPEMPGTELVRELLDARPDIPIIMLTGYGEGVTAEQAKLAGVAEYLMKPFSFHTLTQTIRNCLEVRQPVPQGRDTRL